MSTKKFSLKFFFSYGEVVMIVRRATVLRDATALRA
jgi:hypothetical protein